MQITSNLPLKVSISSSSKDAAKTLSILSGFIQTLPIIVNELASRAQIAAKEIAPYNNISFSPTHQGTRKTRYARGGFTDSKMGGGDLKRSIRVTSTDDGLSMKSGGSGEDDEIKAVMQEFGYPTQNYWGPYPPNPKRKPYYSGTTAGRVKGLGYLRVALIMAADSLNTGSNKDASSISYYMAPSRSDIRNYEQVVERRLRQVISKFLLAYAKGNKTSLPSYYSSKVQVPTDTISQYASKFGNVTSLQINVPVRIIYQDRPFNFAGLDAAKYLR